MASETISTNMSLPIPSVGNTDGPTWATDVNSCLTIIDAHDHTTGNGVQITPNGMNINIDLPFNGNSFNTLKKAGFSSQSAALTGTNFLSFISGNLYVNDGSGNQIPVTSGGGVAGSPGSIGSLASPASATYTAGSKLFSWRADSGKAAAMDNGAVTIRETNVASAKGITLASPSSLAADYQLTLLTALPGSTMALNCDSSGNLGTISYDGIGSGMTSTGANAVATSRTRAVGISSGIGSVFMSDDCGFYTSSSTTYTQVTNMSGSLTVSGNRPIMFGLVPGTPDLGNGCVVFASSQSGNLSFQMDGVEIQPFPVYILSGSTYVISAPILLVPPSIPAAGSHTFRVMAKAQSAGGTIVVLHMKMIVYEL